MKRLLLPLFTTISAAFICGLNVTVHAQVVTPCTPILTNNVSAFISSMEDISFSLKSYSCGSRIEKINNTNETINYVDVLLNCSNQKLATIVFFYSQTEFAAANFYTEQIGTTYAAGLPPTNTTYQTDFTVLSRYNSGIATKHASVVLLSTHLAINVNTSSDDGDSSQDMIQVIKKVEAMRDVMNK